MWRTGVLPRHAGARRTPPVSRAWLKGYCMKSLLWHAERRRHRSSRHAVNVAHRGAPHRRSGLHRVPPPPDAFSAPPSAALPCAARARRSATVSPYASRRGPTVAARLAAYALNAAGLGVTSVAAASTRVPTARCAQHHGAERTRARDPRRRFCAPTRKRVTQPARGGAGQRFRHRRPVTIDVIRRLPQGGGAMRAEPRARSKGHVSCPCQLMLSRAQSRAFGCAARGTDAAR